MANSNVRSIESLEAFHAGLKSLSSDWEKSVQEIRMLVQRAQSHFSEDRPRYWKQQTQLAERALNEAKDNLAQKRAAARPGDRPPATEAASLVQKMERRLRHCELKRKRAKAWSIEISQQCDQLLGPLADVAEHCEILLPAAANQLRQMIIELEKYAEQGKRAN
ncbi:MAG: hypothetical protein CBE00_03800 [Planctomycetaceae bacterium TMED240]|nr:MAG: hypothetical protein CBE00_03800 [Planctomycetaceae bacterium TMED240]